MRDPQDREVELSFWESVRESENPALIPGILEKYPNGEFAALAAIRLGELRPTDTKRRDPDIALFVREHHCVVIKRPAIGGGDAAD